MTRRSLSPNSHCTTNFCLQASFIFYCVEGQEQEKEDEREKERERGEGVQNK